MLEVKFLCPKKADYLHDILSKIIQHVNLTPLETLVKYEAYKHSWLLRYLHDILGKTLTCRFEVAFADVDARMSRKSRYT